MSEDSSSSGNGMELEGDCEEGKWMTAKGKGRRKKKKKQSSGSPQTSTPNKTSKASKIVSTDALPQHSTTVSAYSGQPLSSPAGRRQTESRSSVTVQVHRGQSTTDQQSQSRSAVNAPQRTDINESQSGARRSVQSVHMHRERTDTDRNSPDPSANDRELTVFMRGRFDNMAKIMYAQYKHFESEINRRVGPIKVIRPSGPSVKIICNSMAQVTKLLNMVEFMGKEVDISEPFITTRLRQRRANVEQRQTTERVNRFVIKGVPLDFSDEEIKELTQAQFARRLINYSGGHVNRTSVVVIGYKEDEQIGNFIDIRPHGYQLMCTSHVRCGA